MRGGWVVSLVGLSLLASSSVAAQPRGETWLSDYAAARALARSSGKPLLVVFR